MSRRTLLAAILFLGVTACLPASRSFARYSAQHQLPASSTQPSRAIALTSDGLTLLIVNPDSNSVTLIRTDDLSVAAEIRAGNQPRTVAIDDLRNRAFVASEGTDSILVLDLTSQEIVAEIDVGDRPIGVAIAPDGGVLAVGELGSDSVRFIDPITLSTLSVKSVGDRPYGLSFTPDGRHLLVSHLLSGKVTVLAVQPHSGYLPLVLSSGERVDTKDGLPIGTASSPPLSPIFTISTWPNVAPAPSVIVNRAGTRAYLPQTMANGLGLNSQFDNTVFPKVSVLNLETSSHQTSEHISLPETDRPVGLPWDASLAKKETEMWVVNAASNDVSVLDISLPAQSGRVANIPVGHNPRGIVMGPDGNTAYVNNTLSGTVSVIDIHSYTVTAVVTVTDIPLPPLLLHGKRLFHSSARPDLAQARWISCNTCHIEGEHDGRTWLLQYSGEVPLGETPVIRRNTTSLLGMIETYPLRWSAEWDESADSEFSVRFEQFGSGLVAGDMAPTLGAPNQGRSNDLDSLAAFIDGLAVPIRAVALTPAQQRGREIFESHETGCALCHPAPLYTDLQVHDVGTADSHGEWFGPLIDTPTLRFLYDSAPYLHDGSAATLADILTTANLADKHGVTSHLSPGELFDLVAFLLAVPYSE